jgi:hypothetical protein
MKRSFENTSNYMVMRSGKRYKLDCPVEYMATRSGKRYKMEEPTYNNPEPDILVVEPEPEGLENTVSVTINLDNIKIKVKEVPFDEWKNTVKDMIQEKFDLTEEEIESYPLYNWFQEKTEPIEIANRIRGDLLAEVEDDYYQSFIDWRNQVDSLIYKELEIHRIDLPDFPFYDIFTEGYTPLEMVNYMRRELYL